MDRDAILGVSDKQVLVFDAHGKRQATHALDADLEHVQLAMRHDDALLVATASGKIARLPRAPGTRPGLPRLLDLPSSPVLRMVEGPRNTLVLSFYSGDVGIWDLKSGARLDHARLRGPPFQLFIHDRKLYVATPQGDHRILDLSALYTERCAQLRRVWREVPVVWEGGRAVRRAPPKEHRCAQR